MSNLTKEERKLLEYYLEAGKHRSEILRLYIFDDGDIEMNLGMECICNFNINAINGFKFEGLEANQAYHVRSLLNGIK